MSAPNKSHAVWIAEGLEGQGWRDYIGLAASKLRRLSAGQPAWQPIETAPTSGKPILGYSTEGVSYVCWHRNGSWIFFKNHKGDEWGFEPTHWMPLPDAPAPCAHEAIIGLDGKWHCQRCGDAIEMATAQSSGNRNPDVEGA